MNKTITIENKKDWKKVFENQGIMFVNEKYITQEMATSHFTKFKTLAYIPVNFITQDMVNEYWDNEKQLKYIPKNFITQDMVNEYWNKNKTLWNIPYEYMTQEIVEEYFFKTYDTRPIPTNLISDKMIIFTLCRNSISRAIEIFKDKISHEFIINVYSNNQNYIVDNFIESGIRKYNRDEYYQKYSNEIIHFIGLKSIPEEYITQELANTEFELRKTLEYIPEEFKYKVFADLICKYGIEKTINLNDYTRSNLDLIRKGFHRNFTYIKQNSNIPENKSYYDLYLNEVAIYLGLSYVPVNMITLDLIYETIKSGIDKNTIKFIPMELINNDKIIELVLERYGLDESLNILKFSSKEKINRIYNSMTSKDDDKDKLNNTENNINQFGLDKLNTIIFDKEFCLNIIRNTNIPFDPDLIKYIPTDILDEEICIEAIKRDISCYKYIPNKIIKINNFKNKVIKINGLVIKFFNKKDITEDIAKDAIKSNPECLKFIPKEYIDTEIVKFLANNYNALQYIPNTLITKDIAYEIIKNGKDSISYIPDKVIDFKLCLEAAKIDPTSIAHMPSACANILVTIYSIH